MTPAAQARLEREVEAITARLDRYREQGLRMFSTSSFQTNSVALLHVLSTHAADVPIFFLDTGYHFPETLRFKRELEARFGLQVRTLRSEVSRLQQRDAAGRLLFASDPDSCCHLNKVAPLEPVLASHDVWINGVRAAQSSHRAGLLPEQNDERRGILRFHPLLDWTASMISDYRLAHDLPAHPLDELGYASVGCEPCTRRTGGDASVDDRRGRWLGLSKTECGLHL